MYTLENLIFRNEHDILWACSDILLPGKTGSPSGTDVGVAEFTYNFIHNSPALQRIGLRFLLQLIQFSPFVFGPFRQRFTSLCKKDQEKVLRLLTNSSNYSLRMAMIGLRTALTLGYYNSSRVKETLNCTESMDPFNLERNGEE